MTVKPYTTTVLEGLEVTVGEQRANLVTSHIVKPPGHRSDLPVIDITAHIGDCNIRLVAVPISVRIMKLNHLPWLVPAPEIQGGANKVMNMNSPNTLSIEAHLHATTPTLQIVFHSEGLHRRDVLITFLLQGRQLPHVLELFSQRRWGRHQSTQIRHLVVP